VRILDLSEAVNAINEAVSEAESYVSDIVSDLENLADDMRLYNDGDSVDTLLDGISSFISQVDDILNKIR
jgi:ABC-type transporter Mla subunit MlaD